MEHLTRLPGDFGGTVEKAVHDNPFNEPKDGVVQEEIHGDSEVRINFAKTEAVVKDLDNHYDLMSLIEAKAISITALKLLLNSYTSTNNKRTDPGNCRQKIQEAFIQLNIPLEA